MIQLVSHQSLSGGRQTFAVEQTIRGGYLVQVSHMDQLWMGIYRCEGKMMLVARCTGDPPAELWPSPEIHRAIRKWIDTPWIVVER